MFTKARSIKDIAKKANVSITTVSFIINKKAVEKNISAAVIKRVEDIIMADGYKPNQVARSLRTGNSKIIALMVEDISNPFFASIARLIEEKAYKKGYKIIYSSTENQLEKTRELIEVFKSRQVDAYIIAPSQGSEADISALLDEGKPVVLFDRCLRDLKVNFVGVDHFKASFEAASHFAKNKRKHIALVTVDLDVPQITDRRDGYEAALREDGVGYREDLVLKIPFDQGKDTTIAQLVDLFNTHPEIDAVLFATNYLAISGLTALKQIGKHIDGNFDLIAYDDGDIFSLLNPQVSAVAQPLEKIADNVIDLVFKLLKDKEFTEVQEIILPATLMIR